MSKKWAKRIDDEIFDNISPEQWMFYSQALSSDREEELEFAMSFAEYIGMFFNAKMVKKIKEKRKDKDTKGNSTENPEELIKSGKLKDNPLIELVKKMNSNLSKDKDPSIRSNLLNDFLKGD